MTSLTDELEKEKGESQQGVKHMCDGENWENCIYHCPQRVMKNMYLVAYVSKAENPSIN